jgi:hypothetical protein
MIDGSAADYRMPRHEKGAGWMALARRGSGGVGFRCIRGMQQQQQ